MPDPSNSYTSKMPCEVDKIIIEVTGHAHDTTQSITFYNPTDMIQQESLENQHEQEQLDDSELHKWEPVDDKPVNAWLQVAVDSGNPIKLPLFEDLKPEQEIAGRQNNLLYAVLPAAQIPLAVAPKYPDPADKPPRLALAREGYLYITYNNKIWREIEISQQDDALQLRDISIYYYRGEQPSSDLKRDEPLRTEKREATGKPLKDIWVPDKEKGGSVQVRIAYSEVQWSAAYINYLEKTPQDLSKRTTKLSRINLNGGTTDLFRIGEKIPPMRLRNLAAELQLADPLTMLRDIDGSEIKALSDSVHQREKAGREDRKQAAPLIDGTLPGIHDYGIRQLTLAALMNDESSPDWKLPAAQDCLADARERAILFMPLADPLYDLRFKTAQASNAAAYLQHLTNDASQQKHYSSAELVQRIMLPKKMGTEDNPLNEYLDDLDNSENSVFQHMLRTATRRQTRQDIKDHQKQIDALFKDSKTVCCMRDLSSLDGIEGIAPYLLASNTLEALKINPDNLDTLLPPDQKQPLVAQDSVDSLIMPKGPHPMRKLLMIEEAELSLTENTPRPAPENDGSGYASLAAINRWAGENLLITTEQYEQLKLIDKGALEEAVKTDYGTEKFAQPRRIAHMVDGILRGFTQAMVDALSRLNAVADATVHINFGNAYASNVLLQKAALGSGLGDFTLTTTKGISAKYKFLGFHRDTVSLGSDLKPTAKSKVMSGTTGRVYMNGDQLVVTTNKQGVGSGFSDKALTVKDKAPTRLLGLAEDHPFAKDPEFDMKKIIAEADKAQKSGQSVEAVYKRFKIPYFIVVFELVNLTLAIHSNEKSLAFRRAGQFSAGVDLAVATATVSQYLGKKQFLLNKLSNRVLYTVSNAAAANFRIAGMTLVQSVSILRFVNFGAGILTAFLVARDATVLWGHQDHDAALAMGGVSLGIFMATTAGTLLGESAILWGLGPVGWAGIAIIVIGGGLYFYFKDTPIETWLKNGPFGESPDSDSDYQNLQDNKVAFEQLLNLLLPVNTSIHSLKKAQLSAEHRELADAHKATHVAWVHSDILRVLGGDVKDGSIHFHARQAVQMTTLSHRSGGTYTNIIKKDKHDTAPAFSLKTPGGKLYFLRFSKNIPKEKRPLFSSNNYFYDAHFSLRAQLRMGGSIFPGQALSDIDTPANPTNTPSFTSDEPWWASATTGS